MKSSGWPFLLVIGLSVIGFRSVSARPVPPFDLERTLSQSKAVVMGTLREDGSLLAVQILEGNSHVGQTWLIKNGDQKCVCLKETLVQETDPEVVAFFASDDPASLQEIISISSSGQIYARLPHLSYTDSREQPHPTWTKANFPAHVQRARRELNEWEALFVQPRSKARTVEMIQFLNAHVKLQPQDESDRLWFLHTAQGHGHFLSKLVGAFQGLSKEEEEALVDQLLKFDSADNQARLLAVISVLRPSPSLYRAVLPFVEPEKPLEVRVQAFAALATMDSYLAAGVLSRFLHSEDAALDHVLSALAHCARTSELRFLNVTVIRPLQELCRREMAKQTSKFRLKEMLSTYFHPSSFPLMMEWDKPANQTSTALSSLCGYGDGKATPADIETWWSRYGEAVSRPYDLTSLQGVQSWLRASSNCDNDAAKDMLMAWWNFQHTLPERELIAACQGEFATSAKQLLSQLWQKERLSAEARKSIVQEHLLLTLVKSGDLAAGGGGEGYWRVRVERNFPFPKNARVDLTGTTVINGTSQIVAEGSASELNLNDADSLYLQGRFKAPQEPGKLRIQLSETDHRMPPFAEQWSLQWNLEFNSKLPASPAQVDAL